MSDIETRLGTRTTAEALGALGPLLARSRFVWIMGADSFAGLHRWNDRRDIPGAVPLAASDRPGWSLRALHSPAARVLAGFRLREELAAALPGGGPHRAPAGTGGAGGAPAGPSPARLGVPDPASPDGELDRDPR